MVLSRDEWTGGTSRFVHAWQGMEDFTTLVVQQEDSQVVAEMGTPQGIHVVEETQVADNHEIQLVRCNCITDGTRQGTLNAVHTPVTTDFHFRRNREQLGITYRRTVGQMQGTRSREGL